MFCLYLVTIVHLGPLFLQDPTVSSSIPILLWSWHLTLRFSPPHIIQRLNLLPWLEGDYFGPCRPLGTPDPAPLGGWPSLACPDGLLASIPSRPRWCSWQRPWPSSLGSCVSEKHLLHVMNQYFLASHVPACVSRAQFLPREPALENSL